MVNPVPVEVPIINNTKITENIYRLTLKVTFKAKPGQFLLIYDLNDVFFPRPFSISQIKDGKCEILYKVIGYGTKSLSLKKHTTLRIVAPLGNGFKIIKKSTPLLLCGGIGVASLISLTKYFPSGFLFYGVKTKSELIKIKTEGWENVISTEDGSFGFKGKITDVFYEYMKERSVINPIIYAAGKYEFLFTVHKIAKKLNIPTQISLESIIACGMGTCRGCVIKTTEGYKTVCKDGPVFNSNIIIW